MTAVAVPSARRIAWLRRRRALAGAWAQYRRSRPGMIGLAILALFVAMALAAPLIADESGLRAVNVTDNEPWLSPERVQPARHRQPRAQRLDAARLGRAHQPARRPRRDRARDA